MAVEFETGEQAAWSLVWVLGLGGFGFGVFRGLQGSVSRCLGCLGVVCFMVQGAVLRFSV